MTKGGRWTLLGTGAFLILSGAAHALLGWPELRADLSSANVSGELYQTVAIGWLYGSGAMLTLGAIVIVAGLAAPGGQVAAARVAALIGLLYLIFGTSALIYSSMNPHFIGFIVPGLLLAGAAWILRKKT